MKWIWLRFISWAVKPATNVSNVSRQETEEAAERLRRLEATLRVVERKR